jgi:hypothetical protein
MRPTTSSCALITRRFITLRTVCWAILLKRLMRFRTFSERYAEYPNLSRRCFSENVDLSNWDFRDSESASLVEEAESVVDGFDG